MKWADLLLRFLLKPRDRETISGDLLEEYHEEVLPAKGPFFARLWYLRQVLSFVSPIAWGLMIGGVIGAWILIDTAIEPLAEDTPGQMVLLIGGQLFLWILTAWGAARRTRRWRDAVVAGVFVGVATTAVFDLMVIIRVNVFLELIRDRDDWQGLLVRFHESHFQSLREFANYEYIRGERGSLVLGAIAGAVSGAIGGAFSRMVRTPRQRAS